MSSLAPLRQLEGLDGAPVVQPAARALHPAIVIGIFLALVVLIAFQSGAFQAELSGETDEAAHYITGLMVRDYVLDGFPQDPITFAADYYLHYPKVAFGHWPPVFYIVQAGWMIAFGDSPAAAILLVLVTTAALAFLIFRVVRNEFGSGVAGLLCGALFLLMPIVQKYGQMLMADMPVAFVMVAAALAWATFMDTEKRRYAVYFALLSSVGILTKGNAYALAFLPPVAILISRRWGLVKNLNVWLSAAIVGVVTVPWSLLTRDLVIPTMQHDFGARYLREGGLFYFTQLLAEPGWVITGFALAGVVRMVLMPFVRDRVKPIWASLFALVVAIQIFHMLAPAGLEARYLLPSVAAFIVFLAAGVAWAVSLLPLTVPRPAGAAAVAAIIAVAFFFADFSLYRKRRFGYDEVGQALSTDPRLKDAKKILCSAGADGEGLLISEIARRDDQRPDRIVARGTQVLARMDWNAFWYEPLVKTADGARAVLNAIPADVVVYDRFSHNPPWPHEPMLQAALASPEWSMVGVYPQHRTPSTLRDARIEVYRWVGPPRSGPGHLKVEAAFPKPKIVLGVPRHP
jgi:hypothetical protein